MGSVCLLEQNYPMAIEHAMKALRKDPKLLMAYKTLAWASVKSGITSFDQEDLVLRFFLQLLKDVEKATEYYERVLKKYGDNPTFSYFYAVFLALVVIFSKLSVLVHM